MVGGRAPLCFVVMPFDKKPDAAGRLIDFDKLYDEVINPAIKMAGMEPLRADEEQVGGLIHKPMYERLILCEYAIADLTTANANVFYELGIRHALRPASTVLIFAEDARLPFDVAPLRALPYATQADGTVEDPAAAKTAIAARLEVAKKKDTDSPLFQLVEGMPEPDIKRLKTDVFRDQVDYARNKKAELAAARAEGAAAIKAVRDSLGKLEDIEAGVIIDLFLSYRAIGDWEAMIGLVREMPRVLADTVMVQEQLALALNRAGKDREAERVLKELIERRGPSSETYGILGRVYKDRWERALKAGNDLEAEGHLDDAIETYRKGFETDWRDAYPGINAVTLMELKEPPDADRAKLTPVVTYAVERRLASGKPDYWDWATLLELAVLGKDQATAKRAAAKALANLRETWEAGTTARNLRLIREARDTRSETVTWADAIEAEFGKKAKG